MVGDAPCVAVAVKLENDDRACNSTEVGVLTPALALDSTNGIDVLTASLVELEKPMVEVTWLVVNTGVGVTTGDENCTATELVVSKTSDLSNPAVLESTTVSSSGVTD